MSLKTSVLSSEAVSPGHPDKVCDLVAESLYAELRKSNPKVRFACDGLIKNNVIVLGGELSARLSSEEEDKVILRALESVGYGSEYLEEMGFPGWEIHKIFTEQSPDISRGVDLQGSRIGAGDVGFMYGYASRYSPDNTYVPYFIAKFFMRKLWGLWRGGDPLFSGLRSDMKCICSVEYYKGVPQRLRTVTLCLSHSVLWDKDDIMEAISPVVEDCLECVSDYLNIDVEGVKINLNPTGAFTLYGSAADSGQVSRKIVNDQGGRGLVGGGGIVAKDFTKVDRVGVYGARNYAKRIVNYGLADEAAVQLSYEIGEPSPLSVSVELKGASSSAKKYVSQEISQVDFTVSGIINKFNLWGLPEIAHQECAMWGSVGSSMKEVISGGYIFPWELV